MTVEVRELLSSYVSTGLCESAQFAQIGSDHGGDVHKWTLCLK